MFNKAKHHTLHNFYIKNFPYILLKYLTIYFETNKTVKQCGPYCKILRCTSLFYLPLFFTSCADHLISGNGDLNSEIYLLKSYTIYSNIHVIKLRGNFSKLISKNTITVLYRNFYSIFKFSYILHLYFLQCSVLELKFSYFY